MLSPPDPLHTSSLTTSRDRCSKSSETNDDQAQGWVVCNDLVHNHNDQLCIGKAIYSDGLPIQSKDRGASPSIQSNRPTIKLKRAKSCFNFDLRKGF